MANLESCLKPLAEENWRNITNSMIYIRCPQKLEVIQKAGFEIAGRNDGILALCFVDHLKGLSFYVIAAAHIGEDRVFVSKENKSSQLIFSFADLSDCLYLNQDFIDADFSRYYSYVDDIIKQFEKDYEEAVDIRKILKLDEFRDPQFPDNIEVVLIGKGLEQEKVWVRATQFGMNCIYGILLNEPRQDFGVHKEDLIDLMLIERDGKLSTVHAIKED